MQIEAPATFYFYGGSFNPVHEGHLALIQALAEARPKGEIVVIPNRQSPLKTAQGQLPEALRLEMLQSALQDRPRVRVCDVELRRPAPSFTVDTLRVLRRLVPQGEFRWVLGADAFAEFPLWHRAGEILAQAGLTVFSRQGSTKTPPASSADWEAWKMRLPPPWRDSPLEFRNLAGSQSLDMTRLYEPSGRLLVESIPALLPEISASGLLNTGALEAVPSAARALLKAYLRENPKIDRVEESTT